MIRQKNIVEFAKADLNTALGRYPNTLLEIIEDQKEPLFPTYDFDEAVRLATEKNQMLKSLELETKASMFSISIAKGAFLPSIGARISYNRNNDLINRVYSADLDMDFTATLGASLNLNIFNGFADKADVQRQKLRYDIVLENYTEQKRLLLSDVKQYFLQLEAYKELLEINEENIVAAQENLRLQKERRRVGSGTELEVNEAQVSLTEAQSSLVRAEYDSKIVKAQLEASLGIIEE